MFLFCRLLPRQPSSLRQELGAGDAADVEQGRFSGSSSLGTRQGGLHGCHQRCGSAKARGSQNSGGQLRLLI